MTWLFRCANEKRHRWILLASLFVGILIVVVVVVVVVATVVSDRGATTAPSTTDDMDDKSVFDSSSELKPVLEAIKERGFLRCRGNNFEVLEARGFTYDLVRDSFTFWLPVTVGKVTPKMFHGLMSC